MVRGRHFKTKTSAVRFAVQYVVGILLLKGLVYVSEMYSAGMNDTQVDYFRCMIVTKPQQIYKCVLATTLTNQVVRWSFPKYILHESWNNMQNVYLS